MYCRDTRSFVNKKEQFTVVLKVVVMMKRVRDLELTCRLLLTIELIWILKSILQAEGGLGWWLVAPVLP